MARKEICLLSREGLDTMQIIIFYWGQSGVQVMFDFTLISYIHQSITQVVTY